jgi:hypothetical protein
LSGSERVRLWNVHRDVSLLEFDLPDDPPTLILDVPGVGERKLVPTLSIVRFEPDVGRVVLSWAAAQRVLAPYPQEVTGAMRRTVIWSRA